MESELRHVYLPDSWVLGVETTDSSVCFELDAVLRESHPLYQPPRPGEQYCYARLRWCLQGAIWWNEGPHLDRPAIDATGEADFGNIDVWFLSGDCHTLEGEWGTVVIDDPSETVECLD